MKLAPLKLAIGGDGAGAPLVAVLAEHLAARTDIELTDMSDGGGADEPYAGLADRVGGAVMAGEAERAILVCGTGIGVCISANKVRGIRAALVHDTYSAERAALSNGAQIITMGARVIGPELAKAVCDAWLARRFDPAGRSAANVAAIDALDAKYAARDA